MYLPLEILSPASPHAMQLTAMTVETLKWRLIHRKVAVAEALTQGAANRAIMKCLAVAALMETKQRLLMPPPTAGRWGK